MIYIDVRLDHEYKKFNIKNIKIKKRLLPGSGETDIGLPAGLESTWTLTNSDPATNSVPAVSDLVMVE